MSYPLTAIEGIDEEIAAVLKRAGIRSTEKLLDATCTLRGRKALAKQTGFDEKRILFWANMADRMRIPGVSREYADLLQAAGVDTLRELKYRNPAKLADTLKDVNKKRKMVRLLPSERVVSRWIGDAKKLPLKISY